MASASDHRAHAALQPADCLILLPQRLPAAAETSIGPAHYPAECTQSDAFLQPSLRARKGRANSNSFTGADFCVNSSPVAMAPDRRRARSKDCVFSSRAVSKPRIAPSCAEATRLAEDSAKCHFGWGRGPTDPSSQRGTDSSNPFPSCGESCANHGLRGDVRHGACSAARDDPQVGLVPGPFRREGRSEDSSAGPAN